MENNEMDPRLTSFARSVAEQLALLGVGAPGTAAPRATVPGTAMLPGEMYPSCGTRVPKIGCEGLQYADITLLRFYRSGRTEIDQVVEGKIPLAPGASVVLSQKPRPPWAAGCYSLRYQFANGATHHDLVKIEWSIDGELLDSVQYGSEIFNYDNTVIGSGKLPLPLALGEHCCIGGSNLLQVRITHMGNANR